MPKYQYRAKNAQGKLITGQIDAVSEAQAAAQLAKNGLSPLMVQVAGKELSTQEMLAGAFGVGKPSLQDLAIFSQQMHTLIKAGVPIIKSIRVVSETTRSKGLKSALEAVVLSLEGGQNLSAGMQNHPLIFPPIVISLVNVGENTGSLDDAFLQIAHYMETEGETKKRIKSATRYPMFVIITISLAIVLINIVVVPSFKGFFSKFGAELPMPTRILMGMSDFMLAYWPFLLAGIVISILSFMIYIRSDSGRLTWDRVLLKLPIIGPILRKAVLARFCRGFAMTIKAGVPLLQALAVISNAIGNTYVTQRVMLMRSGLERGESLMHVAHNSNLFTTLVLQMLAIGEETGEVDSMLGQVAGYYEAEVDYDLKKLSQTIEPVLIIIVAGMVLLLALGVFLPMWDMSSVALKKMK
jgi:MSHA biogenesis protein MshG